MSQTAQTWALVIATIVAALLGVIVTFFGTSYQQRAAAVREERARQDAALAELLAAAQDVVFSVRAMWAAYADSRLKWFMFRTVGILWRAKWLTNPPKVPTTWRDVFGFQNPLKSWRMVARQVTEQVTDVDMIEAALKVDQEWQDYKRNTTHDLTMILSPKLSRYFAVATLLTLGEDREIADSVVKLTSKITHMPAIGFTSWLEFQRLASEADQALEEFKAEVDKRAR